MISLKDTPNNFNISDEQLEKLMKFMAGRTDYYWEYKNGVPFMDKEKGKPPVAMTPEKLNMHFAGGNALGFSPFIDNKTIMFLGWDFDAHTSDELTPEENEKLIKDAQEDAVKVYNYLKSWKHKVILNSSGSKGRHVRDYCEGANAEQMRVYGHYVLWKVLGDHNKHEVFPKQPDLNEDRKYGNQMKALFCVHPKKKLRANVMAGNKVLDFEQSLKVIEMTLAQDSYQINISKDDYKMIEELMKNRPVGKFNTSNFSLSRRKNKIPYCAFIETIATTKVLPSKNKYSRHTCIDPNIQAYSYFSPEAKLKYCKMQGRTSDTAFKNWEHYWDDGKPVLKCPQIISYLKHHKGNSACIEGLRVCIDCPQFKNFLELKNKPRGFANVFKISEIAKMYKLEKCPACNSNYQFKDGAEYWYCNKCKKGGGLTKFMKLIKMVGDNK